MKNEIISVIDIGSSSIRMTLYENRKNDFTIIESLKQPVRLGKDCFYDGRISRVTIDDTISILKKYIKVCREYKVKQIKAVATTAVRESSNYDILLDNINNVLNIEVTVLSSSREIEYIYNGITRLLKDKPPADAWAILEIGTGSVELSIIDGDSIIFSRSLAIGLLKLKQIFLKGYGREEKNYINFFKLMIEHELQNLKRYLPQVKIGSIYAVSADIQEIPRLIREKEEVISRISKKSLDLLLQKTAGLSEQELIHKMKVPHDIAETITGALLIFSKISEFLNAANIYIPQITLRDCIIYSLKDVKNSEIYYEKIQKQLVINSLTLGRFLNFDEAHGMKVMELSLKIYDQTENIHKLGKKEKSFLAAAALLHDIGASLSSRSHHKHSLYIIKAQDFFSLHPNEIRIIANTARYHRKAPPKTTHPEYMALSSKDRMTVMKLASILRIADSMDNSHLQLVKDVEIVNDAKSMVLKAIVKDKFYSEAYSFKYKKKLFEEFFGIKIKLDVKNEKK